MKAQTQKHPLEVKALALVDGFRNIPEPHLPFTFEKENLTPGQVAERFAKSLAHFDEVRRTRGEYEAAVEQCGRSLPELRSLCEEAVVVAKRHFGSDPKRMETFGLRSTPRTRTQPLSRACQSEGGAPGGEEVVTMVVEEVTIVSEQASCERQAPNCDEPPPRELPCRAKKVPSRVKPPGEEQKACGSRASRARK